MSPYEIYILINSIPVSILNFYLIYLLMFKSKLITGTYKWLLIIFTICNATHNLMDLAGTVNAHVARRACLVYLTGFLGRWQMTTSFTLLYVFLTMATHMALECLHFLYRYVILCRPARPCLQKERFWRIILFATIVISGLAVMSYVTLFADREVCEYFLKNEFSEGYQGPLHCENSFGILYFTFSSSGELILHWRGIIGILVLFTCYIAAVCVIVVCSIRIRKALQTPALSETTKRLQSQLFALLIAQTIPGVLLYMPLLCLAFLPLVNITLGRYSNVLIVCFMTYHLIEPMIFLYFVPEFRKNSVDLILLRKKRSMLSNRSHVSAK